MRRAIRTLPILLFIAFALFFNTNLVTVRTSELDYLLEDAAGAQEVLNNSMILGRFELLKRRLDQGESRVENYALEARIQALTAPTRPAGPSSPARIGPFMRPLRAVLNSLRFVLGKDAIHPEGEEVALGALEVAYLQERSRNYGQALDGYLRVLPGLRAGSDLRATALLHVAFCESMLNSMEDARLVLAGVIEESPGKEESAVAWKLLGFLDMLQQRRRAALPGTPSDLERAEQAYRLVDYSKSIELLTEYIVTHQGDPRLPEALYFRGRSHEELGEIVPAIEDYRIVSSPAGGPWSREARRRLLLLATIYGQGEKIARDWLGSGAKSAGAAFVTSITPYARIIDPRAVAVWLAWTPDVVLTLVRSSAPPREAPVPPETPGPPAGAPAEIAGVPAEIARAPAEIARVPAEIARVPAEIAGVPAEIARVPAEPPSEPPQPTTTAEAAATPALLQAPGEYLFLPPLRLASNPEPAAMPIPRPTPAGSVALLQGERAALAKRYQREIGLRKGYNAGSWITLGVGVASAGTMGYFLYQAYASYAQYQAAKSPAQAKAMREQTQFNSTVSIAAGVVGGASLAAALVLQLLAPQTAQEEKRIRALDDAIEQLGRGGR